MSNTYWDKRGLYQEEYNELYALLLTSHGKASTPRGELLRSITNLYHEIYNNGGINIPDVMAFPYYIHNIYLWEPTFRKYTQGDYYTFFYDRCKALIKGKRLNKITKDKEFLLAMEKVTDAIIQCVLVEGSELSS